MAQRFLPPTLKNVLRRLRPQRPYEEALSRAIENIVQPGWICADVGANVGVVTELLARLVGPTGSVIAFEAHPDNARTLRKNIAASGYASCVRIENLAISDGTQERLWLYAGRGRSAAEWNIVGHDVEGNRTPAEMEIPATCLDKYFVPSVRLDFIKIDVEGAEAQVLAGMRRVLRDHRPMIALEFHNDLGWAGRTELFDAGYELYNTHGTPISPEVTERVYHCIAVPKAKGLSSTLAPTAGME